MKEVCRDSRGNTLFVEDDPVGGRTYWSDEVGGGTMVWSTSLVSTEMMHLALRAERGAQLHARLKSIWSTIIFLLTGKEAE